MPSSFILNTSSVAWTIRTNLRASPRPAWLISSATFVLASATFVIPFLVLYLTRARTTRPAASRMEIRRTEQGLLIASLRAAISPIGSAAQHDRHLDVHIDNRTMMALSQARAYGRDRLTWRAVGGFSAELYRRTHRR